MMFTNFFNSIIIAILITMGGMSTDNNNNAKMVAVIVGHSETSQGATSNGGLSEFELNSEIAIAIRDRVKNNNVIIIYRDNGADGYKNLPQRVNSIEPYIAISLHANASLLPSSGHEVLYMRNNLDSAKLAYELNEVIDYSVGNIDRGTKPKDRTDRGGLLLWKVKCPVVILEPFFINNNDELDNFLDKKEEYINGLVKYIDEVGEIE